MDKNSDKPEAAWLHDNMIIIIPSVAQCGNFKINTVSGPKDLLLSQHDNKIEKEIDNIFNTKYVTKTENALRLHRKQHLLKSEAIMGSSIEDKLNLSLKIYSIFNGQ